MWAARSTSSVDSDEEEEEDREGSPDFCSSPEVLTWMKMLRGAEREGAEESERALCRALADLSEVRVSIAKRFGMAARRGSGQRWKGE